MKSCLIYFSHKIENIDLTICFLEIFLENLIKNKVIGKIHLIKNKNINEIYKDIKNLLKKYKKIEFEEIENYINRFNILNTSLNDFDIIINNEILFYNEKEKSIYYDDLLIKNIKENNTLININLIELIFNYLKLKY